MASKKAAANTTKLNHIFCVQSFNDIPATDITVVLDFYSMTTRKHLSWFMADIESTYGVKPPDYKAWRTALKKGGCYHWTYPTGWVWNKAD